MELNEKIAALRKEKGLTQEELAQALFVSRTAISKWESGRGCPSIDSLKALASYFGVTVDVLLSSDELLSLAQKDSAAKVKKLQELVFGLLDLSSILLVLIPLFGQTEENGIRPVSLLALTDCAVYVKGIYFALILLTALMGVLLLLLQNWDQVLWVKSKIGLSLLLSITSILVFMATLEPYAATFSFVLLLIKGILLLKRG